MSDYAIGVDLGGTNLRAGAVDSAGRMFDTVSGSTPVGAGRNAIISDIVRSIETIQARTKGNFAGTGIGIPGFILMETGVVAGAPNLPEFVNYPVRDEIEKRLGSQVILENDANAAALGEKWIGAGRDVDSLVLLTLGTGIGGGIILDGRIVHGYLGMAGELGHITISPNGYPCGCGNRGCVEKYASATAVSAMARLLNLGHDLSSEDVFHLAAGGNERARSIFRTVGESLGTALANLINTLNAPLYLLGGGLLGAWDLFSPAMFSELEQRSFIYRTHPPRIERAQLGNQAGLYGAAYLPLQSVSNR